VTRPFVLGLTGSIGMGKSTTADMFKAEGVPVWDADAAVDRLYSRGGAGVEAVRAIRPAAVRSDEVDRDELRRWTAEDRGALPALEAAVHPLVAKDRAEFLAKAEAPVVLLDIPLLFETGAETELDAVVVATAPADVQRQRVLSRPGMTREMFSRILARQLPDAEKRARADFIVETLTMDEARETVRNIVKTARARADARDRA